MMHGQQNVKERFAIQRNVFTSFRNQPVIFFSTLHELISLQYS